MDRLSYLMIFIGILSVLVGCPSGYDDDVGDDDSHDEDDDSTDDDDTENEPPCDDDTAGGVWSQRYEGEVELDVQVTGGSSWSGSCPAWTELVANCNNFDGAFDCGDITFSSGPFVIDGRMSGNPGNPTCIDGAISGSLAEAGAVDWWWVGEIDTGHFYSTFSHVNDDVTVSGILDMPGLPISMLHASPNSGVMDGGYEVTLNGIGLDTPELQVWFDATEATEHGCWEWECQVVVPPSASTGTVDITVQSDAGTYTRPDAFTYTQ